MSRPAKLLIAFAALILVLVAGAWLALRALVSDSTKQKVLARLSSAIGAPVTVGDISVKFGRLLQLRPALSLTKVTIGNPPGFKSRYLLEADEFHATVDLRSLMDGSPDIRSVSLVHPVITVERNAQGDTNLQKLVKQVTAQESAAASQAPVQAQANAASPAGGQPQSTTAISIDDLNVTKGEVHLIGVPQAGGDNVTLLSDLNYTLDEFAPGKPAHNKFDAKVYGGKVSQIAFEGLLGPPTATALPIDGKFDLKLGFSEIPAAVLAQFGSLLKNPGNAASIELNASLKGDAYGRATGPLQLALNQIQLGPDPKRTLPLNGKTSGQFAVSHLLASPSYAIQLPDAALQLGRGQLKAAFDFASAGTLMEGSSKGSVSGIDIQEFLAVFSPGGMKVTGQLSIPKYSMKFEGENPDAVLANLTAQGALSLGKGRIEGLDLVTSIKTAIDNPTAALQSMGAKGSTEFADLKANFAIAKQVLRLSDISLDATAGRITGNGSITMAQALNFQLEAQVTGRVAELMGKQKGGAATIPVTVAGTVSNPTVRPQAQRMIIDTGLGYLDKFLGGRGKK